MLNVEIPPDLAGSGESLNEKTKKGVACVKREDRDKRYRKDLHQQAYEKLTSMQAFGESKRAAAAENATQDKIYSYNTHLTYFKHCKYYIKWLQEEHPECVSLKKARKYAGEWLQQRVDQGLSAWTIQTEAKALGKLFGIKPGDPDYFEPPKRNRADIKRSRGDVERDRHFSTKNNDELIKFCQGTGLRKFELEKLKGGDLLTRQQIEQELQQKPADKTRMIMLQDALALRGEFYLHVKGKGGKERIAPIIGRNTAQIVARIQDTPAEQKVWQHIHTKADIHGYRGDYATQIYRAHAREIDQIPFDKVHPGTGNRYQSEVYVCRKDEAGKRLDRAAMLLASKALGHNRVEVVANNYIRGL